MDATATPAANPDETSAAPIAAPQKPWRTILGILFLAIFFALLHWNTAAFPLMRDEGEYAYCAWLLNQGVLPYSEAFLQKPPMIVYTYWLALHADNGLGLGFRVLMVLFHVASAIVLGAIAGRELGPRAVWPARLLLGPLLLMPDICLFAANTEHFMILPLLGLWLIYTANRGIASARIWLAAGAVAAIAFFYKYNCAPFAGFIFFVWAIDAYRTLGPRPTLIRLGACLAGFVLMALLITSPFLIHDGGRALYECTIQFNKIYASTHLFSHIPFFNYLLSILTTWWPLILLGLLFLLTRPSRWWLYLGLIGAALISTAGSLYPQYYLLLMPLLAFIAAGGMLALDRLILRLAGRDTPWLLRTILFCGVIAAILPNFYALTTPPKRLERLVYSPFVFSESIVAAEKVAQATLPDERVLIAGSEPQILYYARRRSATRFIVMYQMMIPTPLAEGYQEQAIKEILANPPKVVIEISESSSWLVFKKSPPDFVNFLSAMLTGDFTPVGAYIKTPESHGWTETPGTVPPRDMCLMMYTLRTPIPK